MCSEPESSFGHRFVSTRVKTNRSSFVAGLHLGQMCVGGGGTLHPPSLHPWRGQKDKELTVNPGQKGFYWLEGGGVRFDWGAELRCGEFLR